VSVSICTVFRSLVGERVRFLIGVSWTVRVATIVRSCEVRVSSVFMAAIVGVWWMNRMASRTFSTKSLMIDWGGMRHETMEPE